MVEKLAGLGIAVPNIASFINVSEATLLERYGKELGSGKARMIAHVGANLLAATSGRGAGAIAAQMFVLRALGGWRTSGPHQPSPLEAQLHQPSPLEAPADLTLLSDEDLETLARLIDKATPGKTG